MRYINLFILLLCFACSEAQLRIIPQNIAAPLVRNRFWMFFGDSYTFGTGASPIANSYVNLMVAEKVVSSKNFGVGGRGVYEAARALNSFGVTSPGFNKHVSVISVMAGFNDLRRAGGGAKTLKKIEACYRSIMLNGMLNFPVFAGNSVTKTGGISSFNATTYGGFSASGASTTGVDTWTWTFSGEEFGIQFIASDGVVENYGTAIIKVDGNTVATINTDDWYDGVNDGSNNNDRGPLAFTYHGFGAGLHTVTVESQGDGRVVVDFFANLLQPVYCSAFLFWEIPYMTPTGYAIPPADQSSTAISDDGSEVIEDMVTLIQSVGRRAAYVPSNTFYNLGTDVDADDVHPNNSGHDHLHDAGMAATF